MAKDDGFLTKAEQAQYEAVFKLPDDTNIPTLRLRNNQLLSLNEKVRVLGYEIRIHILWVES